MYHEKLIGLTVMCLEWWKFQAVFMCATVTGHANYRSVVREKMFDQQFNRRLSKNRTKNVTLIS